VFVDRRDVHDQAAVLHRARGGLGGEEGGAEVDVDGLVEVLDC
jgi:hypothetical protein